MARAAGGIAVLAAATGVGLLAVRRVAGAVRGKVAGAGPEDDRPRWHAVTVFLTEDEVAPGGRLPAPLAGLGTAVDVRLREAPGGKGTEIHVRPLGEDGRAGEIRSALRRAKRLLETGEVLEPDSPGSAQPTPLNAPLRAATAHGMDGGRL